MTTTVTRIKTNKDNYSRYDSQCDTIIATLYLGTPQVGDILIVDLVRLDGYGPVKTNLVTVPDTSGVIRTTFVLEECTDPYYKHIYRAKSGDYQVACDLVSSPTFSVSLISLRRMRNEICLGLPLLTGETIGPLQQPKQITGVEITKVKPDVPGNVYLLSYNPVGHTLTWNNGTATDVSNGGTFYLADDAQSFWIQVEVDELLLPTISVNESIFLDEQEMADSALLAEIKHAEAQIGDTMKLSLEPTQVGTQHMVDWIANPSHDIVPPTTAFVDKITSPVDYIKNYETNQWYGIQLPVRRLIQPEAIHGFLNTTDVVTIDDSWWTWNEMGGTLELVPNQAAAIAWQFYSGFFYNFLMGSYQYVPQFWHYKATIGIRKLDNDFANILQAVEYRAGANVLRQAALHAKPGYTGENLSRDGMSQSIQYQKGIYGDTIEQYESWLAENMENMTMRHYGLNVMLFG